MPDWNYGDRCVNPQIDAALAVEYSKPMARLGRMVLPGIPHHVTQRGDRREQTFFDPVLEYGSPLSSDQITQLRLAIAQE